MFDTSLGVPVDDPVEINIQKCQLCVGRKRNEIGAMKHQSRIHRKHVLSPVVIKVSKSLNWEVAEHIMLEFLCVDLHNQFNNVIN